MRRRRETGKRFAGTATSPVGHVQEDYLQLAGFVFSRGEELDRRFLRKLEKSGWEEKARLSLVRLTVGAASAMLAGNRKIDDFLEEVEYNGRRLAQLNVPPVRAAEALAEYDALVLKTLHPPEAVTRAMAQLRSGVLLVLNNACYQVREAEADTFFSLFQSEILAQNLDDLLRRFLATLKTYCRADFARAYLLMDDGWTASGSEGTPRFPFRAGMLRALRVPRCFHPGMRSGNYSIDPGWRASYKTCWSVPLLSGARFAGVLQFAFCQDYAWLPREQELLAAAAQRSAVAIEKVRLLEELAKSDRTIRQLARRMMHAEELERRRISRELHDEAGQSLLCVRLQLEMLENGFRPSAASSVKRRVRETRKLVESTIVEMRRLIAALSPSSLEQLGLSAAIRQLVRRFRGVFGGSVSLSLGRVRNLSGDLQTVAFRVVQECLNNIAKHSQAHTVRLSVRSADGYLRIEIIDDGVGFNIARALSGADSFGLRNLGERVNLLGGNLEIQSRPKSGTRVKVAIPLVLDTGVGFCGVGISDRNEQNSCCSGR